MSETLLNVITTGPKETRPGLALTRAIRSFAAFAVVTGNWTATTEWAAIGGRSQLA